MPAFTVTYDNAIAVVTFDLPAEPVNKLTAGVIREFEELMTQLRANAGARAVVFISAKPDTFIAGADIEEFVKLQNRVEAEALSRKGQELMMLVEDFPRPVIAAIHGACVGGGYELALACHWRIATDSPKTQIGLPEVQLGIIPAAGGSVRLPRLIGTRAALDIILQGRTERPQKAFRLGMIDELVPPSILREVALAAADRLAQEGKPKRTTPGGATSAFLDRTPVGRSLVFRTARQQVLKKTAGNYPAPLAALDVVRISLEQGLAAGFKAEHERFGELAVSSVSRKLVQIFFATTALKKDDGIPPDTPAEPRRIRRVGIVGSGFMGSAIAGVSALNANVEVRLKDAELVRVGRGLRAAAAILDERLKRRRITRPEHQRLVALLSGSTDYSGFTRADLAIEAVFEELGVKRTVVAELEAEVSPEAIIATNTSTIPISRIADGAEHPERIIGMHFFSPVEKMPLLEVIPHEGTSPSAIVSAVRFGRKLGKTVIVVRDHPGFWVNRILSPYVSEAAIMVEEGVPIDLIDRTMTKFGFPVGPVALMDEVGLDVAQKAAKVMHEAFGDRLKPSPLLERMIADDRLGRKNARGFYAYSGGHKSGVDERVYRLLGIRPLDGFDAADIERRLVHAMLNEAAMAYGQDVVRSPRDGDIGALFGIGFPPFRGGPLRMIDDLSATLVVDTLRQLAEAHGQRFTPAPALVARAATGNRYYPEP